MSKTPLELRRSEPNTHGVGQIVERRVAKALQSLQAARPSDKSVHTARKELKKARATLRLLRDSLHDVAYQRENLALRDAARPYVATAWQCVIVSSGSHGNWTPCARG